MIQNETCTDACMVAATTVTSSKQPKMLPSPEQRRLLPAGFPSWLSASRRQSLLGQCLQSRSVSLHERISLAYCRPLCWMPRREPAMRAVHRSGTTPVVTSVGLNAEFSSSV